jgi:hypothetical protein
MNVLVFFKPYFVQIVNVVMRAHPLQTLFLERLDCIHDRLLQRLVLETQCVYRALVVVSIQTLVGCTFWIIPAWCRVARHIFEFGEVLLDDLANLLVRKVTRGRKEALVGGFWFFESRHVGLCNVAYIDPKMYTTCWDLVFKLALCRIQNSLVRRVHIFKAIQSMYLMHMLDDTLQCRGSSRTYNRSKNHRWVDGGEAEVRLLLLNKVPRGLLSKCFTGPVAHHGVLGCLFRGNRVPVVF